MTGQARPGRGGLTEVVLEAGGLVYSTDVAAGHVGAVVHPWEVSVAREAPADSALNHVTAPISSLVPSGNRVRVRVGPITAEVTAASAGRLGLEPRRDRRSLVQGDRDPAVATRLTTWPKGGRGRAPSRPYTF